MWKPPTGAVCNATVLMDASWAVTESLLYGFLLYGLPNGTEFLPLPVLYRIQSLDAGARARRP